jgi:hypothetical protein
LRLASTKVTALVFDCLDYGWSQKSLVKIDGETRTGKTEAIKAWCDMNPGKARLVSTPSGKGCGDLFRAIAQAIGLPCGPKTRGTALKEQIQYIIRHAGLFLVFDEAHFLIPAGFDRNTPPARLDWIRTQIIDKDLPVALVTTPQAFGDAAAKFQNWTGYNFNQFFGRIMRSVSLPDTLDNADVLAVVKILAPDIPENLHRFIAGTAQQSAGYLNTAKAICKLARHIARRNNRPGITQADVELAASEFTTAQPARPAPAAAATPERRQPLAVKRSRAAAPIRPVAPAPPMEMPDRETAPAIQTL